MLMVASVTASSLLPPTPMPAPTATSLAQPHNIPPTTMPFSRTAATATAPSAMDKAAGRVLLPPSVEPKRYVIDLVPDLEVSSGMASLAS